MENYIVTIRILVKAEGAKDAINKVKLDSKIRNEDIVGVEWNGIKKPELSEEMIRFFEEVIEDDKYPDGSLITLDDAQLGLLSNKHDYGWREKFGYESNFKGLEKVHQTFEKIEKDLESLILCYGGGTTLENLLPD